jgi:hypothetical protein
MIIAFVTTIFDTFITLVIIRKTFTFSLFQFVSLVFSLLDSSSCIIALRSCDVERLLAIAFHSTWDSNSLSHRERRKEREQEAKRDFAATRKRRRKIAFDDVREEKKITFDDVRERRRAITFDDVVVVDSKTQRMTRNSSRWFVCERIRLRRRRRLHIWLMLQNTKNEFFTNHFLDYIFFLQSCNDNWCKNLSKISTSWHCENEMMTRNKSNRNDRKSRNEWRRKNTNHQFLEINARSSEIFFSFFFFFSVAKLIRLNTFYSSHFIIVSLDRIFGELNQSHHRFQMSD